jgi:hypothetical protein
MSLDLRLQAMISDNRCNCRIAVVPDNRGGSWRSRRAMITDNRQRTMIANDGGFAVIPDNGSRPMIANNRSR